MRVCECLRVCMCMCACVLSVCFWQALTFLEHCEEFAEIDLPHTRRCGTKHSRAKTVVPPWANHSRHRTCVASLSATDPFSFELAA